ncbi:MAG: RloB family protein [Candidatus Woesearchaeota archaeon]
MRKQTKSFLIYCEGKTERQYFGYINQYYKGIYITVKEFNDDSPSLKSLKLYLSTRSDFDYIFIVTDIEDKNLRLDEIKKLINDIEGSKYENIEVIFSNPCFELWFLLHFKKVNYHILTKDIKNHLNDSLHENYNKSNLSDYFIKMLMKNLSNAIRNNKSIYKENISKNPNCNVYNVILDLEKESTNSFLNN